MKWRRGDAITGTFGRARWWKWLMGNDVLQKMICFDIQ